MNYSVYINSLTDSNKFMLNNNFFGGLEESYKIYNKVSHIFNPNEFAYNYLAFNSPVKCEDRKYIDREDVIESIIIRSLKQVNSKKDIMHILEKIFFIKLKNKDKLLIEDIVRYIKKG